MKMQGTNTNTGAPVDEYGCAITWLPVLLIENTQKSRETGAAVESFRNAMTQQNGIIGQALLEKLS